MCGGLQINKRDVRPGQSIKYRTLSGERMGIWGLGGGHGAYNARSENITTTWNNLITNKAVVQVDSFDEKGVSFRRKDDKPLFLAAVHDVCGDLVIITKPAYGGVEKIHHRMPLVLNDPEAWIKGEVISEDWDAQFVLFVPPQPTARRKFLQSL